MHFERAKFQKKKTCAFWAAFSLVQTPEGRTTFTALLEPIKVGLKRVKICKSNLAARALIWLSRDRFMNMHYIMWFFDIDYEYWTFDQLSPIWSISKYQALMFLLCIHIMLIILWTLWFHRSQSWTCMKEKTKSVLQWKHY